MQALERRAGLIRIPQEIDVPLTPRVRQIIDAADFHRLAHISQLGLVALVYPAAHHTRFEHSLGVYRMALLYLRQLALDGRFQSVVSAADAENPDCGRTFARSGPLAFLPSDRRYAAAFGSQPRAAREQFLTRR